MDLQRFRRALEGDLVKRVLRSSGFLEVATRPLYSDSAGRVNSNHSNYSCQLLVDENNMQDGKIPQVLGIALAAWLVNSYSIQPLAIASCTYS